MKIDGTELCKENPNFEKISEVLEKKANVAYITNVNITNCVNHLKDIAIEFHKNNIQIAINLEDKLDYKKLYSEKFSTFNPEIYRETFKQPDLVKDWVDYIVIDNAMEFMTFDERRSLVSTLRELFPTNSIGFRFTEHFNLDKNSFHPNRQNLMVENFWPKDNDGDFIITSLPIEKFKRTKVYAEESVLDKVGINGEFVE